MEVILLNNIRIKQFKNSVFFSNTYLITHDSYDYVWLVDCGDIDDLLKWLERKEKYVAGVFLTHSHYDHIYGLNNLKSIYQNLIIYTSKKGCEGLKSDKLNLSRYHDFPYKYMYDDICILNDGESVDLFGDIQVEIIDTKGHDWSCISFKLDKCLFTGDSYIPGVKTVTTFPNSNKIEALNSEKKILYIIDSNCIICPGHGEIRLISCKY